MAAGVRLHLVKYPLSGEMLYAVNFAAVSPDGKVLVAGILGALYFWELTDGKVGSWAAFRTSVEAFKQCAWSPDGRLLALADADSDGTVRLWPWPAIYEAARAQETS